MNGGCTRWLYTKKWLYTLLIILLIVSLVVAGCDLTNLMTVNPATTGMPTLQPPTQTIEPTGTSVVVQVVAEPTQSQICIVLTNVPNGYLNLRSGSGLSYSVIRVLHEGDKLTYLGQIENGFRKVQLSDNIGWVRDLYVSCNNN